MPRSVVDALQQPWYILLASGSNGIVVYGVVLLTAMSFSLGVAMKDTTAAIACAIHRPQEQANCVGIIESVTGLFIVSVITMGVAYLIVKGMCTFWLENCNIA